MLRLRLQRHGSTHNPIYRVVAVESTTRRDGSFVEVLGSYNPKARGKAPELQINLDRAAHWISVGAQPSDTVKSLIKKAKKAAAAVVATPAA